MAAAGVQARPLQVETIAETRSMLGLKPMEPCDSPAPGRWHLIRKAPGLTRAGA